MSKFPNLKAVVTNLVAPFLEATFPTHERGVISSGTRADDTVKEQSGTLNARIAHIGDDAADRAGDKKVVCVTTSADGPEPHPFSIDTFRVPKALFS